VISVAIATVCGTHVDQEFVLGSIRQHSSIAKYVLVLDVTPTEQRRRFRNLPDNVIWIFEDGYQSGTKMFAFRLALIKSLKIARSLGTDAIMQVDSDEILDCEAVTQLFPAADKGGCVENLIVTWGSDGMPYFRRDAWIRRLWSSEWDVSIPQNTGWQRHPEYNGNPERNPIPLWPKGVRATKVQALVHHHLHWAFPQKGLHSFGEWEIAKQFARDGFGVWPESLQRWRFGGTPPSQEFL